MNRSALAVLLSLLVLAGCGSKGPLLVPKNPEPPQAVNFSGLWQLRPGFADTNQRIEEIAGRASRDGGLIRTRTPEGEGRGRRQRKGSLMHVFLETGSTLKITQTDYALFISLRGQLRTRSPLVHQILCDWIIAGLPVMGHSHQVLDMSTC